MVAATTGLLTFISNTGETQNYQATIDDVANNYMTFNNGQNFFILPPGKNWLLRDFVMAGAGSSTTKADIQVNGLSKGYTASYSANQGGNPSRQFLVSPLAFQGGSNIMFKELA